MVGCCLVLYDAVRLTVDSLLSVVFEVLQCCVVVLVILYVVDYRSR